MRKHLILLSALTAVTASAACLPVNGDRILGRDLAMADPKFSALPPAMQLGYAPVPGVTRIFAVAELQRIARANGIAWNDGSEVCFEIPTHAPADAEFIDSMRRSLPSAANLRLIEMGKAAIPPGRIEFPLAGLEPLAAGNDGVQLWRGFVQYTGTRRIPVWARVSVVLSYAAVIATHDLAANIPIDAAALRVETKTGPLNRPPVAARVEDVSGRILQQPLKAGSEILLSFLDDPPAVRRGDSVKVEVVSGLAVLRFDAIAQSSAKSGELAELRNPLNGKLFRARIRPISGVPGSTAVIVVGAPQL